MNRKAEVVNAVSFDSSQEEKKEEKKINCDQTPRKINFNTVTGIGRMYKKIALEVYIDQTHSNPQAQIKFSPEYLRN